ncbi:nose resistant to fluoxetine protein 6-like [Branchiostoma floridae x Branchiostoma japonicum]
MKSLFRTCLLLVVLGFGYATKSASSDPRKLTTKLARAALQSGLEVLSNLTDGNLDDTELPPMSRRNISEHCRKDIFKYWQDLRNGKTYALIMLDSFGKPPSGILSGNYNWLGRYAECNKIIGEQHNITFNGEYYLATLTSVQTTPGITLKFGVCVPSSCSKDDVIQQLEGSTALEGFVRQGAVQVTARSVSTRPVNAGTMASISICATLGTLLVLGTVYDFMIDRPRKTIISSKKGLEEKNNGENAVNSAKSANKRRGVAARLLLPFSLRKNVANLLSTEQPPDSIQCLHGIRVISMSLIIFGHTYIIVFFGPTADNQLNFRDFIESITVRAITGAFLVIPVDTFFFLSGLLMAYLLLQQMNKKSINYPMLYVYRYFRLTPVVLFVMMITAWMVPQLFTGPVFPEDYQAYVGCSATNWWKNLLYINNVVYADDQIEQ